MARANSATNLKSNLRVASEPPPAIETPKRPYNKKVIDIEDVGVIGQLRLAVLPKNRLALGTGVVLGGLVPLLSYVLAHHEIDPGVPVYAQLVSYLVLGGLVFSAKSVYDWCKLAFHNTWKALGFLVLVEGTMVLSHTYWLGLVALTYLIAINAVNTGVNLALGNKKGEES